MKPQNIMQNRQFMQMNKIFYKKAKHDTMPNWLGVSTKIKQIKYIWINCVDPREMESPTNKYSQWKKATNEHHPGCNSDGKIAMYIYTKYGSIKLESEYMTINYTVFFLFQKWLRYVWNVSIWEMYTTTVALILYRPIGTLWICLLHV